ncbi:MAG: polysaccharide deacetylase [Oscillospiraceae bacterium]|jgi:peptidoglycan/xylan/chitin deacetylase (PgdA/CDA1 family)|nr:polysaccharide deacetylase [Oscillospiraceae bacterium]
MYAKRGIWPEDKNSAAMVTVNLDAEYFIKIFCPEADIDDGDSFLMGRNGMKHGLPRLLDVLDDHQIRGTFFVPADVARRYPQCVQEIARRGHEIGCHGDKHENLAHLSAQEQREVLSTAKETLREITGYDPIGFRMPEGEITGETLSIAKAVGFRYSSSLSDSDFPYVHKDTGLLELPVDWALYDLPYFAFVFDPHVQRRITPADDVLVNWKKEFEGSRRWGTLFNLQLDPQAIGERGRIFVLDELFDTMQATGDVWFATGAEVLAYCQSQPAE